MNLKKGGKKHHVQIKQLRSVDILANKLEQKAASQAKDHKRQTASQAKNFPSKFLSEDAEKGVLVLLQWVKR